MKFYTKNSRIAARLLILLLTLSNAATSFGQAATHIYTDFAGWWSSGVGAVSATKPNGAHNLLAFRVGSRIFSTNVNNTLLDSKGLTFVHSEYKALPVVDVSGIPTASTYVGLGKYYGGSIVDATHAPLTNTLGYYLTDGINGLDIGTGVYNLPISSLTYKVDQFKVAAINDSIPDVVATQIGEYSSSSTAIDTFKFVDINGATVGKAIALNFGSVAAVGESTWAFFEANKSPMPYTSNPAGDRFIRIRTFDLHEFEINNTNVGNIYRFVHTLAGVSDEAFMAYNTSSFRALADITPGCNNSVDAGLWLRSNFGVGVASGKVQTWSDNSANGLHFEQAGAAARPTYNEGASRNFNYNPYFDFNDGNWMGRSNSPFLTSDDSIEVFILAKPTATAGTNKLMGMSIAAMGGTSGPSRGDYPAISLNATAGMEFSHGTTINGTTTTTGLAQPNIWQINFQQGAAPTFLINGTSAGSGTATTMELGTWYTQIGDGAPGDNQSDFDMAEVIVFPGSNTAAERARTLSYLAIKYGIQLPFDYMSGDNTVIWTRTAASGAYNNRIFGIGREDCQGLAQKQSTSQADVSSILTIGLDTIATTNQKNFASQANGQYLMYGDNGGSISSVTSLQAKTICAKRADRIWRVQRKGTFINTQNTQVKVRIDMTTWAAPGRTETASNYYLLIDRNANGSFDDVGDVAIMATKLQGGYAYFNNVKWDSDASGSDLFTIAIKRADAPAMSIAGTKTVCVGNTTNLTATPSAGTWSSLAATLATVSSLGVVTGVAAGTPSIRYAVTYDAGSCTATLDSVVTVRPRPQGTLTGGTYCEGELTQLTFDATAGATPYTLIVNGVTYTPVTTGVKFDIAPIPTTTTTYNLTKITDANGCVRNAP